MKLMNFLLYLHQGSTLNPYLFALVMDELTRHMQDEVPWCMLFADDIVLVAETKVKVNAKLELWRESLESKGLKISKNKTEYMECNFSKTQGMNEGVVSIEGHEIPTIEQFRYLGSILHAEEDIGVDVTYRIKTGWTKWRNASGVLCDRHIPLRLIEKFCKTPIRPYMLYATVLGN